MVLILQVVTEIEHVRRKPCLYWLKSRTNNSLGVCPNSLTSEEELIKEKSWTRFGRMALERCSQKAHLNTENDLPETMSKHVALPVVSRLA